MSLGFNTKQTLKYLLWVKTERFFEILASTYGPGTYILQDHVGPVSLIMLKNILS